MSQSAPAHLQSLLERASTLFRSRFGRDPSLAVQAPGRVNLIGEHTDYNAGLVLPVAIQRACVIVADVARDPSVSRIFSESVNEQYFEDLRRELVPQGVTTAPTQTSVRRGQWSTYIAGVAAQFQKRGATLQNFDAVIVSSVPLGGGLSSSASLEVAFATLISYLTGLHMPASERAELCQKSDHEFVGVPCGIMDQFISAAGQAGHALLIDCRDNTFEPVALPSSEKAVLVIADTGVKHSHAGGEYAQRAAACAAAARALELTSLREVAPDALQDSLQRVGPEYAPYVAHVFGENQRVEQFIRAIRNADLTKAGEWMTMSHTSLKMLYRVSCDELDRMVEIAQRTPGVFGARMTGGGFGGCIVALVAPDAVPELVANLERNYRTPTGGIPTVFASAAAAGAGALELP